MRNIIIAVVAILALVVGGVGGTVAGWSDSEIAYDNYIQTGSLDLKVNDQDDLPWGAGIYGQVVVVDAWPCQEHSVVIDVHNAGQGPEDKTAYLYIHFKEMCCIDVPDKMGQAKPEPELVAEYGGMVDQVEVEGIGDIPCFLADHTSVTILLADGTQVYSGKMKPIECEQIFVCELPPCNTEVLTLIFHVQQIEDPGWEELRLPEKFKDWPTNALMKDRLEFNIEFDLLQDRIPE